VKGLRSTLALGAALALLAGYIFFIDAGQPTGEEAAGPEAFDVEADDIDEITVTAAGGSVSRLARDGDGWRLIEPIDTGADAAAAAPIAGSLASLVIQRELAGDDADLAAFGLAPARITVAFRTGAGDERVLEIGGATPAGDNLYARTDGGPVVLIGSFLETTFDRTPFDLRDKRVAVFDAAGAESLTVETGGETRRFARRDGTWTIEAPVALRGDHAEIDELVTGLASARLTAIAAEDVGDPSAWGLDAPTLTATVTAAGATATLLVGGPADDAPAGVFARDADRAAVFVVPASLIDTLQRPINELRTLNVFDMRPLTATRLEVVRDRATLALERIEGEEPAWRTADGDAVEATLGDDVLTTLTNLRAAVFLDERHPALARPSLTVSATLDDGRTETVTFARDGDDVFAARDDEPGSVRLELTTRFEAALAALDALGS
jgi:hypothetical protein